MQTDQYPGFSAATVMPEGSAELPADGTTTSSLNSLFMPRLLRSSSLDGVLNKGDIKLEDLLDEEDFVYDLKNGNPKLLDYFAKNPGNIRNLIDYVTIMPPDPEDTKRAHKYPFVACEVFEADVAPIMNAFFFTHAQKASEGSPSGQSDKASLLEYLFTFLDTDKEINPVLAGYFNKVVQVLFKRNPRRMVEFVYEKEAYLMSMVNHLQEKSIAELISLFICYENSQTDESHQSRLGTKIKVLDKIFETLTKPADENYGEEASINAGHILNEIIQKHNAIIDGKELIKHIASSTTTQKLFDALKNADIAKITSVGDVLSGILKYYAPDAMDFGPSDSYGYGGQSEQEKVTQVISQNMDIFLSILLNEGKENKFETVFGSTVKSIGSGRLKIIEILEKIVKLDNMEIYDKVSDLNLLKIVTDLFNEAPWNNILHSIYEQLINTILDKADNTLFKALFEQANFLEIIIQAGQNPQHELPKRGRKVRKGYMGHVIRLANELVRYGNIDDTVEKYLKSNRNWDNFVYNVLKKQNEINNTQIGGHNPRSLVGAPHMESSFGSLAESQPMMMPQSSESFAAMPSYEEEIMQGERSPNKAGDIGGSFQTPTFDWKESVGQSVDALVETIFRKTKNEFDLGRNPTLDRLGVEGIHEVKRHEDSEMAKSLFGNKENKEGRRSFGRNEDLGPKEDHDNRFPGGSPEKGTKNSLNSSPGKDHEKNASPDKQALSEEAKAELFKHLREKNPATAHMTQSAIARARKVKLKLKKGEKANPLKIFEAINKYKSSRDMSASTEFTFTESSMTDSRQMESEGAAVLEEEQREEVLAKLKEEENNKGQDNEANGVNGVKAEGSPQKVENSPEKST